MKPLFNGTRGLALGCIFFTIGTVLFCVFLTFAEGGNWIAVFFLIGLPIVLIVSVIGGLFFYFGDRCPKCKRFRAMDEVGGSSEDGPGRYQVTTRTVTRCKYCGHQEVATSVNNTDWWDKNDYKS